MVVVGSSCGGGWKPSESAIVDCLVELACFLVATEWIVSVFAIDLDENEFVSCFHKTCTKTL